MIPDVARIIRMARAQREQNTEKPGPTLPRPCQCPRPIKDEDTCVRCGHGVP